MNQSLLLLIILLVVSSESFSFKTLSISSAARPKLLMSSTVTPEVLVKDGGVLKELVVVGKGKNVETGDILAVEYSAYLSVWLVVLVT